MNPNPVEAKSDLLSLPQLARCAGLSLDRLRRIARNTLLPAGLLVKIGPTWVAKAQDVEAIVGKVREMETTLRRCAVA